MMSYMTSSRTPPVAYTVSRFVPSMRQRQPQDSWATQMSDDAALKTRHLKNVFSFPFLITKVLTLIRY